MLSLGAVFAGLAFHEYFVGPEAGTGFWHGSVAFSEHLAHAMHEVPLWVKYTPLSVMLVGFAIAYRNYMAKPEAPADPDTPA